MTELNAAAATATMSTDLVPVKSTAVPPVSSSKKLASSNARDMPKIIQKKSLQSWGNRHKVRVSPKILRVLTQYIHDSDITVFKDSCIQPVYTDALTQEGAAVPAEWPEKTDAVTIKSYFETRLKNVRPAIRRVIQNNVNMLLETLLTIGKLAAAASSRKTVLSKDVSLACNILGSIAFTSYNAVEPSNEKVQIDFD